MATLGRSALLVLALGAVARAQIPSLGWCPDYVPMADFNMDRVSTAVPCVRIYNSIHVQEVIFNPLPSSDAVRQRTKIS